MVLPVVLNSLADVVGGAADDPAALAEKIGADPNAAVKVQAIEGRHKDDLQSALDFAKLQADQNAAYLAVDMPIWSKIFFAGARPLQMWLTGPLLTLYQIVAATGYAAPLDPSSYAIMAAQYAMLAGARTYEKGVGTASPAPLLPAQVKRILSRKEMK
ncbi:hypothetical protein K9U39_10885 [Rhodoblastus acidophilus]|nr:hypothetical protein [Rhodoblastus acidophilus]